MNANLLYPLITLMFAKRERDSGPAAATAALMTLALPSSSGLMLGLAMAANAARPKVAAPIPIALPPPPAQTPAKLTATPNVPTIKNDGSQSAVITVIATDATAKAVPGAPIDFSVDSGVISPASTTTDMNGLCTAVLGIGMDNTVRTINVTAACGALSAAPFHVGVVDAGSGSGSGGSSSGTPSTPPAGPDLTALTTLLSKSFDEINSRLGTIEDEVDRIRTKVHAQLGQNLLAQVAPPGAQRRAVPSFLWKSKEQARSIAKQLGLPEPTFITRGDTVQGVVIAQQPKPGSPWSEEDDEDVSLELG